MDPSDIILALLTAAVAASWGQTQWRLARVERDIAEIKVQLANKTDRAELAAIWEELRKKPDREELAPIREELSALRADLTQVALAVGASRPQATEG